MLRPQPRPSESEILGLEPSILCLARLPGDTDTCQRWIICIPTSFPGNAAAAAALSATRGEPPICGLREIMILY